MNSKKSVLLSVFLTLPLCLCLPAASTHGADNTPGEIIFKVTEKIISSLKTTRYTNTGYKYDKEKGILYSDCSWFAKLVLKTNLPAHYDELPKNSRNSKTSLAKDYFNFFSALKNGTSRSNKWKWIEHPEAILPGDILVYKHQEASGTTGHIMIAMSKAALIKSGQYSITVADSAWSPHGNDTRSKGLYSAINNGGAGIGDIIIKVMKTKEEKYSIAGHKWQTKSTRFHNSVILVGRTL